MPSAAPSAPLQKGFLAFASRYLPRHQRAAEIAAIVDATIAVCCQRGKVNGVTLSNRLWRANMLRDSVIGNQQNQGNANIARKRSHFFSG